MLTGLFFCCNASIVSLITILISGCYACNKQSLDKSEQLMMVCRKAKHHVCCSCHRKYQRDGGHNCVYPGCTQRANIRVPSSQIRRVAADLNYQFNMHCPFAAYGCQHKARFVVVVQLGGIDKIYILGHFMPLPGSCSFNRFLDMGDHMQICPHRPVRCPVVDCNHFAENHK